MISCLKYFVKPHFTECVIRKHIFKGLAIRGGLVSGAGRKVKDWLMSNKLII